jgi:probable HAF family extracellular repeat protein
LVGAVSVLVIAGVAPATAHALAPWRIIDLGAGDESAAVAINDHGHVVGQNQHGAFLWRAGRLTYLGVLGTATDINNNDEVVGYGLMGAGTHAFLWRNGTVTDLGVLPGGDNSFAQGINDRGDIVGWSATAPGNWGLRAVLWRNGAMVDLGAPAGGQSLASDINDAGVIVGQNGEVAVRWRHGAARPLMSQPAHAEAVNNRGEIAGYHWGGGSMGEPRGFVWQRGKITDLTAPSGGPLMVTGINIHAQVVGYMWTGAFVWQRGWMTVLPNLVVSSAAYDVNDHGQIVGASGTRSDGLNSHAVLWTR